MVPDPAACVDFLISYLLALLLLLVNDHVLKDAFPGVLTGKLSDFAGLFAFAVFFASVAPRRAMAICTTSGVLFVWWKSPASQWLVDALQLARVVDWTDLTALVVLPLAYRTAVRNPVAWKPMVAAVSLVAFAATSVPHQYVFIDPDDSLRQYATPYTKRQLMNRLENCAIDASLDDEYGLLVTWVSEHTSPRRRVSARAAVEETQHGVVLTFSAVRIDRAAPSNERAVRDELQRLLDSCVRR